MVAIKKSSWRQHSTLQVNSLKTSEHKTQPSKKEKSIIITTVEGRYEESMKFYLPLQTVVYQCEKNTSILIAGVLNT